MSTAKSLIEKIDLLRENYKYNAKLPDITLNKDDFEKIKVYLDKKAPRQYNFKNKDGFFYKDIWIKTT